ncbi:hypothetical protein [Methylobacterium sp. 174MFSha1.1]|uniref:hypothetical protein n=1 Tax=Methylobacterium sp. 174MFSha1.1 TaxID=1502749 RepID=UPI0011607CCB|nr:hypothetical protein [Methylobacterium sp. 174MFSha1.1]
MTTDDTKPAQRRGRPRLAEEDRKSSQIKLRARAGLREQLEEAAAQSGRSVSEEAEKRLENSFNEPEVTKKISQQVLEQMRYDWFGSMAMFDNALVYSKLLYPFLKEDKYLIKSQTTVDTMKKLLGAVADDLIQHLLIAARHQKEHDASFVPSGKDDGSGTVSFAEMSWAFRMSAAQAKVFESAKAAMQTENTSDVKIEYEE